MSDIAPRDPRDQAREVVEAFEVRTGLVGLRQELHQRPDGPLLTIELANPSERFFSILRDLAVQMPSNDVAQRTTLLKRAPRLWVASAEALLLQRTLSESLTVDRHSFKDAFFARYIKSAFGAESQIEAAGNHMVFGRRGSGKSSLLVYAMRKLEERNLPYAWVAMQTYDRRVDARTVVDVLLEILEAAVEFSPAAPQLLEVVRQLKEIRPDDGDVNLHAVRALIPAIKRGLAPLLKAHGRFTIFLDDLHVIDQQLQPFLLGVLYSFARGNGIFLKISAIENFTTMWNPSRHVGLEAPNDAQIVRLDYNLTMPEKAREHIENILDAHATYCGLPSAGVLARKEVTARLVWVAAGVPRDAINVFVQAMAKAAINGQPTMSVTNVNLAAAEAASDKMRYVAIDTSGTFERTLEVLELVKAFCIVRQRKNAFLVEIRDEDPNFNEIKKLIDLRFLHVLSPSITPSRAGVRNMALLLDYGFYLGMRAAKSMDLFQRSLSTPGYGTLRKLPRFDLDAARP